MVPMVPMVHFSDHATNDPLPGPFQPHVSFQPSPLEGLEGLRMLQHQWQIRVVPIYIWCIPIYPSVCSIVVIVFINSYWSTKYVTANLTCPSLIWVSVSPTDYILSFSHQYCHFGIYFTHHMVKFAMNLSALHLISPRTIPDS